MQDNKQQHEMIFSFLRSFQEQFQYLNQMPEYEKFADLLKNEKNINLEKAESDLKTALEQFESIKNIDS